MVRHDRSYKLMFAHPRVMEDLIRGYLPPAISKRADLSTLERAHTQFVSDDLRERDDDIIWRVRVGGVWHYVVVEFQSTVDEAMPIRVVVYVGLLCQDLLRAGELGDPPRMPPVLPVVFYHGARPWNVPVDVAACQQDPQWPFRPRLPYWLVAVRTFEREPLIEDNVVSAIIALECARTATRAQQVLNALAEWLRRPEDAPVRRAMTTWIRRVLLPTRLPESPLPDISTLEEVIAVLSDNDINWGMPYWEKGHDKGLQEGQARLVLRQLEAKFGPLDEPRRMRVAEATEDQLDHWGVQLLTADSLEAIFGPEPSSEAQ